MVLAMIMVGGLTAACGSSPAAAPGNGTPDTPTPTPAPLIQLPDGSPKWEVWEGPSPKEVPTDQVGLQEVLLAPDFELASARGASVSLSSLLEGRDRLVIVFCRGYFCEICRNQLGGLQESLKEFEEMNVGLVAISVDEQADAASMANLIGAEYPLLADPSHETSSDYGVFNLLSDDLAAPAVFIVGSGGEVQSVHLGRDRTDRPGAAQILEQVRR